MSHPAPLTPNSPAHDVLIEAARDGRYLGAIIDLRPGFYYVSAVDGPRWWPMSGPYSTHREALDNVDRVKAACIERDGRSHFMAWGTCRSETTLGVGRLDGGVS